MQKLIKRKIPNWLFLALGMSVVGFALFLSAANKPLPEYLVAAGNLRPGQLLEIDDFETAGLELGPLASLYLKSDELPAYAAVSSVIRAGELVPAALLIEEIDPAFTALRFTPGLKPAESVKPGSWVSIWQVVEVEGVFETQRLVARAQVSAVVIGEGLFAAEIPEVEISVRIEDSALILSALSAEFDVYVLPVL